MKLLIGIVLLGMTFRAFAVNTPKKGVPKYNTAAEAVYKGTVEDLRDRQCPVSGGVGSHIILKLEDGSTIEVTGWKLEFDGVQTIFAREVKHRNETYVFRAKDGTPAWMY